jgi:hypothetical protein
MIAAKPASVDLRSRPLAKANAALPSRRKRADGSPPEILSGADQRSNTSFQSQPRRPRASDDLNA